MFGHDDNQQQQGQDNSTLNPALPNPVGQNGLSAPQTNDQATNMQAAGAPLVTANDQSSNGQVSSGPALPAQTHMGNDALLNIKQQALQHLSPLVSHLDQTPEEKFRTTMMMIQASDDQTLIKSAFEAAQGIADDKARAQALLDIINEINYFTQHQNQSTSQ